jgi:hypothetical protein
LAKGRDRAHASSFETTASRSPQDEANQHCRSLNLSLHTPASS